MKRLIEWLLDLEDIRLGRDAPLMLKWDSALEAWLLVCIALVAITWVVVIYRRESASLPRRVTLAGIRCGLIALVVAVLCRPSLVLQRNRVEPSHVVLVLDSSLSMAATDRYRDAALASSLVRGAGLESLDELSQRSRLSLIQEALTAEGAAPLRKLLERNVVDLRTFAGQVEPLGTFAGVDAAGPLADSIRGVRCSAPMTDLAGAIGQVINRTQGRRLAAIVLATDGQSTQPTNLQDVLDLARDRRVPVFPLRVGSALRPLDIEVGPLRAEESVFVDDLLAVEARVSVRGAVGPTSITVHLVDQNTGETVASEQRSFAGGDETMTVELRTKPPRTGVARYRVEVPALAAEVIVDNNVDLIDVAVMDNELRVLYVESYPRYEYRYLKNALLREKTIELSVLLIEADERFVQEGTDPIRRFPETPEELNRFDVVLFGDVDPQGGWLTAAQMIMLLDFVGNEGGGFGLIAGERAAPHRFLGTPLEKLIPIRIDPTFQGRYETPRAGGFRLRLTAEGRQSRLFRLSIDPNQSEAVLASLPELYWHARTLGPKPGASILAQHETDRTASGAMPLVVTGRYGAGRLFFQATDDTWRWRRHTGELLHDTYWVQVVRDLMESERVAQDRRFSLRTDHKAYAYGAPVRGRLHIVDSELLSEQRDAIELTVRGGEGTQDDGEGEPDRALGAGVAAVIDRVTLYRLSDDSPTFEGTWIPPGPGRFVLEASTLPPLPGERPTSVPVRVERPDLEGLRPEANHDVLERIASQTGGAVLELDALTAGFDAIRDRSMRIPDDLVEPLWDSKLVLMLFVTMISMEWALRKVFGLV